MKFYANYVHTSTPCLSHKNKMKFIVEGPRSILQGMEAALGFDAAELVVARLKEIEHLGATKKSQPLCEKHGRKALIIRALLHLDGTFECIFTGRTYEVHPFLVVPLYGDPAAMVFDESEVCDLIKTIGNNEIQHYTWKIIKKMFKCLLHGESEEDKEARQKEELRRSINKSVALNVANQK